MPRQHPLIALAAALLAVLSAGARGDEPMTREDLERWFADDSEQRALAVNEGQLAFLPETPPTRVPHSHNTFTISADSIDTGWVALTQCYDGLDAVAAAQVVYRYREMRALHVTHAADIGRTWVEGNSVQMQDIGPKAKLCIGADVRVFYQNPDGSYSLVNGPYHRRFLDGYYPLQVTLAVHYPHDRLDYVDMQPPPQPGLTLNRDVSGLTVEAWFEGELNTEIRFRER